MPLEAGKSLLKGIGEVQVCAAYTIHALLEIDTPRKRKNKILLLHSYSPASMFCAIALLEFIYMYNYAVTGMSRQLSCSIIPSGRYHLVKFEVLYMCVYTGRSGRNAIIEIYEG